MQEKQKPTQNKTKQNEEHQNEGKINKKFYLSLRNRERINPERLSKI